MSIETEITRISTNVSETLNAVSEMGGTVPENATSDDMASGVRSIPVGAKINDTTPSTSTTYSSSKIESEISKLNEANVAQDERLNTLENASGIVIVEPADGDIPKVFIDGEIPTSKTDVLAEMTYISRSKRFHAFLKIKCQGTSSMSYPKKNFTVKLYADEARSVEMPMMMRNWGVESSKYVLKANYVDHSHARNIVDANLWSEIVASRADYASLPDEIRSSPNNGAVDGFPIKVYTNGTYQGIYTWNIGKDAWMWGMDVENANHVLLCNETNTDGTYAENASNFRALWNGVDGTNWSVEVGTNSTAVKDSLNALISCVKDTTDDEFRAQIGNHLDLQSAIDYYIHCYADCGLDSLAKNMLLGTYDLVKWYMGRYDMDSVWGLYWNGSKFVSATYRCPEDYQEQFSLLWERLEALYYNEIKTRYAELRAGVLSFPNIVTKFERFMDVIGLDLYAEDLTIYTGIPQGSTNSIKQIRDYVCDRLAYVDAEIAALEAPAEEIPCTGITLDQTELTFDGAGTQTLTATVTPSDTTDAVTWSSDDLAVASVNGGVVTAKANGNATITATCGAYSATCVVSVSGISEEVSYDIVFENGQFSTEAVDYGTLTGPIGWDDGVVEINEVININLPTPSTANFYTTGKVNVEGKKSLCLKMKRTAQSVSNNTIYGVCSKVGEKYTSGGALEDQLALKPRVIAKVEGVSDDKDYQTLSLDISGYTETTAHVFVMSNSWSGATNCNVEISKIWLE